MEIDYPGVYVLTKGDEKRVTWLEPRLAECTGWRGRKRREAVLAHTTQKCPG